MADIWQDFIGVVTSTCARIYGGRGARNRREETRKRIARQHYRVSSVRSDAIHKANS